MRDHFSDFSQIFKSAMNESELKKDMFLGVKEGQESESGVRIPLSPQKVAKIAIPKFKSLQNQLFWSLLLKRTPDS